MKQSDADKFVVIVCFVGRDKYVILHKGCLYYYNSSDAKTTAGKFSLSGYRYL